MSTTGRIVIISMIILVIASIVGFGIFEAVQYSRGRAYLSNSDSCGTFPKNITSFEAEKQIFSQWNWTYKFNGFSGSIKQSCPTTQHDVDVYVNDVLSVRANRKFFSLTQQADLKDCHGNTMYVITAGDAMQAFINGFKIDTTLQLRDSTNDAILAYVKGTHFITNDITLYDTHGNQIAHSYRNTLSFDWKWKITIFQQNVSASDPRVLTVIAGMQSFDPTSDDGTDICNNMFWGIAWTFLAIGIILFCLICYGVFLLIKKYCDCCPDSCNNINSKYAI